ncbi:MAG: TonB-dependent receptor [Bacteroidota bacterium]
MKNFYSIRHQFSLSIAAAFFIIGLNFTLHAQENLTKDTLQLSEVEVLGKSVKFFPMNVIPAKTIEVDAVRDIGDYLRQQPNVSGIRKGGVGIDPVIRGFKYNQVTVLLNSGVKIEGGCPNRMDPVASHVESENIQKIEVIKGPYVLKFGPVLGAMINLETVLPHPYTKPEIHGEVLYGFETNWNGQREHIALAGGNDKVFFNASGGFKGYGSYTGGNDILYNTSFQKLYGTAGAGFIIKKNHQIILSYAYDQGKDVMYPALPMDERLDQTHVGSFNYTGQHLGKIWQSVELQSYFSQVHHVMDNLNRSASKTMQAVTTVDALNAGGKLTGSLQAGTHKFLVGLDFEHVYKDGDKQMTMKMIMEGDTFISVKHANVWLKAMYNNTGAFAEYKIPFKKLDFTAALRIDYNQATSCDTFRLVKNGIAYFDDLNSNYFNVSFSLGMKKQLVSWLYLSASLGKGTRSPSVLERFIKLMPVQYDSYDYLGNPQLKPENNYQADASFEFLNPNLGILSVGGFFSLVTDYIIGKVLPPSVIKPSTQGAPGVKQFSNTDKVYLTGFEVSYQSPTTKKWGFLANVAATYGTEPEATKYIVSGGQVTGEETVKNDPLPEIPPLEGTVRLSYKFFRGKLIPNASVRMVSEQNRVSQSYGESKTPGFITAAVSVSYAPCKFASLVGGIENIFDTPYYEHLNRRIVGSTERLYEPGRFFYLTFIFRI